MKKEGEKGRRKRKEVFDDLALAQIFSIFSKSNFETYFKCKDSINPFAKHYHQPKWSSLQKHASRNWLRMHWTLVQEVLKSN
jgi:hypothetical protein